MSLEEQISAIVEQYKKHGWDLSRVLLSGKSRESLGKGYFGEVTVIESDLDAAWFTRPSSPGQITWELRALTGTPFALLEVFDDHTAEATREARLNAIEVRLRESRNRHRGH
jgi:hypothetical protein